MGVVAGLQPGVVHVEAVGVLHDELAAAQQAGAGARLVAVFGLDLVQRERQVLVGGVQVLDREREHLLVRRPEQHVGALAVGQPEQVVAVVGPATGRLVRFARQQRREEQFLGAHGVHLLAHDRLDLAQHPQPERQPGVHPRRGPPDVTRPHQQPVARQLGVGRVLAQGPQEQSGHAQDGHRVSSGADGRARPGYPSVPRGPSAERLIRLARSPTADPGASARRAGCCGEWVDPRQPVMDTVTSLL